MLLFLHEPVLVSNGVAGALALPISVHVASCMSRSTAHLCPIGSAICCFQNFSPQLKFICWWHRMLCSQLCMSGVCVRPWGRERLLRDNKAQYEVSKSSYGPVTTVHHRNPHAFNKAPRSGWMRVADGEQVGIRACGQIMDQVNIGFSVTTNTLFACKLVPSDY